MSSDQNIHHLYTLYPTVYFFRSAYVHACIDFAHLEIILQSRNWDEHLVKSQPVERPKYTSPD